MKTKTEKDIEIILWLVSLAAGLIIGEQLGKILITFL